MVHALDLPMPTYSRICVNLTVTLHKSEKCNRSSAFAAYSISALVPFVQRALEPAQPALR